MFSLSAVHSRAPANRLMKLTHTLSIWLKDKKRAPSLCGPSSCGDLRPMFPCPPMSDGDCGLPGRISIHWLRALMLGWRLGCAVRWTSWLLMDELLRSDKSTEQVLADTTRPCPHCYPYIGQGGACTCRSAIPAVSTNSVGHRSQRRSPRRGPVKRTEGFYSICSLPSWTDIAWYPSPSLFGPRFPWHRRSQMRTFSFSPSALFRV